MKSYYYFCFTIYHGEFSTTLLSDLHDNEQGAMKEFADDCNGDNVDFYLGNERPLVTPLEFDSLDTMAMYAQRSLSDFHGVHIKVITRYITKETCAEDECNDDESSFESPVVYDGTSSYN
jgi:hypothetical protein